MKNEMDEQLKAVFDKANVEDLGLKIDTEALWQKIEKPKTKNRKIWLPTMSKYAAALLLGAFISWIIMQNTNKKTLINTPKSIVINVPKVTVIQKDSTIAITTKQPIITVENKPLKINVATANQHSQKKNYEPKKTIENLTSNNINEEKSITTFLVPENNLPEKYPRTYHINDIEKNNLIEVPNKQKFNNLFAQKTIECKDEISFSNKVINQISKNK